MARSLPTPPRAASGRGARLASRLLRCGLPVPEPATADAPTDADLAYMEEVASRALGNPPAAGFPTPETEPPGSGAVAGHIERAAAHAHMGRDLTESERLLALKRGVLRVANLFAKEQVVYNESVVSALRLLDRRLAAVPVLLATAEADLGDLDGAVDRLAGEVVELRRLVEECGRRQQTLAEELAALRAGIDAPPR
jgi:N-acyl-D-aspartate/D-glutamate deacylase